MKRFIALAIVGVLGLAVSTVPASAARGHRNTKPIDWNQHDTAVYVVSTLNVLRNRHGRAVTSIMARRLSVRTYEVWSDLNNANLFFINLKRTDGTLVGELAYQMGWARPMSLTPLLEKYGIRHAPQNVSDAYSRDPKQILGSFNSTMPQ